MGSFRVDHRGDVPLFPAGLPDHGHELLSFIGDDGQDGAKLDRNFALAARSPSKPSRWPTRIR